MQFVNQDTISPELQISYTKGYALKFGSHLEIQNLTAPNQ